MLEPIAPVILLWWDFNPELAKLFPVVSLPLDHGIVFVAHVNWQKLYGGLVGDDFNNLPFNLGAVIDHPFPDHFYGANPHAVRDVGP